MVGTLVDLKLLTTLKKAMHELNNSVSVHAALELIVKNGKLWLVAGSPRVALVADNGIELELDGRYIG